MNVPQTLEIVIAEAMRGAELGSETVVRPWQAMMRDGSWDKDVDREFPCLDIRFAPERTDDNQVTLVSEGEIRCCTKATDDKDHAVVSAMYEAAHGILRGIFRDFIDATGSAYTDFTAAIAAADPGAINVGGVSFAYPLPPSTEDGINMIGIGFAVHFSYA